MTGPIELLGHNRRAVVAASASVGARRLRQVLARAQHEMAVRLRHVEGLKGPGKDSFTAHQLRVTLVQIAHVLAGLNKGIESIAVDQAGQVSGPAVEGLVRYMHAAEKRFRGITERLPLRDAILFERAKSGAESSVLHRLEPDPKRGPGILKRYGDAVVKKFEGHLQQRLLARTPWADVRNQLIADSPFLQQAPAHWAERIVRSEAMNSSNRSLWEANKAADEQLGDVVKILSATFDDRTGADSVAVHGQVRRPEEAFEWWDGLYQHPPNRPNDREVVVTHRMSWPLPAELAQRSDAEVHARWVANGRKGSPPGRPKMTTVDMSLFGKVAPPKVEEQQPTPFASAKRPIVEPPFIPERQARGPIASPDFDENVTPFVSRPDEPPEEAPLDLLAQKEGGQQGTNEGGLYRGSDGVLRYVKFYKDPVQAQLEDLTNKIYRDLGVGAVESRTFDGPDGRKGYASDVVEGETLGKKGVGKVDAKRVMKGFAADVLVGNWDAVGLNHDNVIVAKGKALRVDNGGALLYRAQGGKKPAAALQRIDEWEKFFDPSTNPAYAKVAKAAGVAKAEDVAGIKDQIKAIQKLRKAHGGWDKYLEHAAPGLPEDVKIQVVGMLAERTRLLGEKLASIEAAAKQAKAKAKPAAGGAAFVPRSYEHLPEKKAPEHRHIPSGWPSRGRYQDEIGDKLDAVIAKHPDFKAALYDYTGGSYREIRQAGHLPFDKWKDEFGYGQAENQVRLRYDEALRKYAAIDRAFDEQEAVAKGPRPEAKVTDVYRGIGQLERSKLNAIIGASEWEAETLTSVAWSTDVAEGFMYNDYAGGKYAALLHFKLKEGKHLMGVETHSSQGNHEKELLLRKGARFKVVEVSKLEGRSNRVLIELEEI